MIKIYNTLTQQKENFKPLQEGQVGLYVCGMTVYDLCHLGHARFLIAFDVIARYLRYAGFDVTYVRNITDVDDKIIKRANENGEDFKTVSARFIDAMHEDLAVLNLIPPTIEPKATDHIDHIIAMVKALVDKGLAYVGEDGDVFYDVRRFKDYGKLSKRDLDQMRSGARVAVSQAKKDPLDFVLWKRAKEGEPSWSSPWGEGRPGWHIECSAMSTHCLGNHFDLHGGGMDLIFPHHENEIAQSEGATGETFVNTWMHVGFLKIDQEKMSKSLGNFFTIRDVLKSFHPEVLKYLMISSHYRSPVNYTTEGLEKAHQSLERFYTALRGLDLDVGLSSLQKMKDTCAYETRFKQAMDDDFNTPEALSVLFDLAKEINKLKDTSHEEANRLGAKLKALANVLGFLNDSPEAFLKGDRSEGGVDDAKINALIENRNTARKEKNWALSDQIRDELKAMGVVLEDGPNGTTWRRG